MGQGDGAAEVVRIVLYDGLCHINDAGDLELSLRGHLPTPSDPWRWGSLQSRHLGHPQRGGAVGDGAGSTGRNGWGQATRPGDLAPR